MPESKNRRKRPARRPGGSGRTAPAPPPVDEELARLAAQELPGGSTAVFDPDAAAAAVAGELTERSGHGSPHAHAPTPTWYKVIMLGLMVVGLLWLIVYYLFQGVYPVPGIGSWNIGVGLVLMMAGLVMTTKWR